jgi:NAD(P)H-hydrate epimerase
MSLYIIWRLNAMKIVSVDEMREIDKRSVTEYNIPSILLMESAGRFVVEGLEKFFKDLRNKNILIICGPGNNGGDGFVIARYLYQNYRNVEVIITTNEKNYKGDALTNIDILENLEAPVYRLVELEDEEVKVMIEDADILIDAIFGTGLKSNVKGELHSLINLINESANFVVAVDIPSGLNGDTGMPMPDAVCADITFTMGLPKIGFYTGYASDYTGEVISNPLCFPRELLLDKNIKVNLVTKYDLPDLYKRDKETHKGDYGKIFIIGTSPGLTGAGYMAGKASLYSGAGLITLGCPESLNNIIEVKLTEVMTKPLPDSNGHLTEDALEEILEFSKKQDIVALGCGIGRDKRTIKLVRKIVEKIDKPLIIDADGIFALKDNLEVLKASKKPIILTPHPGEFANLVGVPVNKILEDRLKYAISFATEYNVYLVLKGHNTIIVEPDGEVFINPTGNPGMATGGMGDVLTGLIATLIFIFESELEGVISAVYLHGYAGDILFYDDKIPYESITPEMLIEKIPTAIKRLFYETKQ